MAAKAKDKDSSLRSSSKATNEIKNRKAAATTKSSHLSQVMVVDSDDEDAVMQDRSTKKVISEILPSRQHAVQDSVLSDGEGSNESNEEEDSAESDDANETLPPQPSNKVPSNINGVKRTSTEASESGDDTEEESEDASLEEEPAPKRQKAESKAGHQGGTAMIVKENTPNKAYSSATAPEPSGGDAQQAMDTAPIAAKPFQPPSGYSPIDMAETGVSADNWASLLAGKQIWHVTAPSNVPLSTLQTISQEALRSGNIVLSHKGVDYSIKDDAVKDDLAALMLPGPTGFGLAEQRSLRKVRIQQHITLPNLSNKQVKQSTGSDAAAQVARASVNTIRPQPSGLRMRYRPLGMSGASSMGWDSESASGDDATKSGTSLQFPRALGAHGVSGDHSHNSTATIDDTIKKTKRRRREIPHEGSSAANHETHDRKANAAAELSHQDGATATVAAMPAQKVVAPGMDSNGKMADANSTTNLSKEEKVRRKEEKKLRKEAKHKAKTS